MNKEKSYWFSGLFLFVLVLKIAASFFLSSSYLTHLFAPFLSWFVLNHFQNPWEFFYSQNLTRMFPYPPLMLWLMSLPRIALSPFLPVDWNQVAALNLFAGRIPLLAADLLLFSLLLRLFAGQQKKLIRIYWCSPIIFFINYMHGQLDIIPTAIFFAAVYLAIRQQYLFSAAVLALAAATKNHSWIAVPFLAVFLYKKRVGIPKVAACLAVFAGLYAALIAPYWGSEAFRQMVFHSPEQQRLFEFVIPLSADLKLLICPTVLALLFVKFVSYQKLNREILLMFLGIVFASLVVFVPPMPGWFMWSLPFLIYFYLHNKNYSSAPFIIYNAVYLLYFIFFFESHGDWVRKLETSFSVHELALSMVMSCVGFIAFWMFKLGIRKNEELRASESPILIGIGGDSGSGKHTLLRVLRSLAGKSRSIPIFGDDFHKWERGNQNWNVYTHLNPNANRLHQSAGLAVALKDGREIEMVHYDHHHGKFTNPQPVQSNKFIFFVGLHPFYLKKMRDLIPIKIYMDTEEELRRQWKIRRDVKRRGHSEKAVMDQIIARQEDHEKFIEPQKQFADLVISYSPVKDSDAINASFVLGNSIDLEGLIELLLRISSLKVEHTSTIDKQTLTVSGKISARQIMETAQQLDLNFDELLINPRGWVKGHKGVAQLVFLLLYNHHMKAR